MAADGTLTMEFQIKCPAAKFFNIYADHVTLLPKVIPHMFRSTKVISGDGKSVGSVVAWEYILEPPTVMTVTQTIEAIDEENMLLTKSFYSGDLAKYYDLFKCKLQAFTKDGKNYVKWTLDYKKAEGETRDPHHYMDFISKFTKEFDAHLMKE